MPGDGTHRHLYMRFTAQFRVAKNKWKKVSGQGRSKWIYAGSALFRSQELGYTFSFDAPKANQTQRRIVYSAEPSRHVRKLRSYRNDTAQIQVARRRY